jgi:hypothetical protein
MFSSIFCHPILIPGMVLLQSGKSHLESLAGLWRNLKYPDEALRKKSHLKAFERGCFAAKRFAVIHRVVASHSGTIIIFI